MGVNWKLTAIVASLCLVLSLLVGLLARNDFWSVVLKALILALLGGALVVALRWAAFRFLPELAEAPGGAEPAAPELGRSVDIVVEDSQGVAAASESAEAAPLPRARRHPDAVVGASADQGDEEFAQEVEELRSQEIIPGGKDAEAATYEPVRAPSILEDVDVLPDLDGFQDAFAPSSSSDQAGSGQSPESESPSFSRKAARGSGLSADDPSTLAQAIRTVLAKEKKG